MIKTKRTGDTAERFVTATLELIEEQGGSHNVNLREVARRVGVAHTNLYHYFDGFPSLMWEALRRGVVIYGEALSHDLDDDMAPLDYYRKFIENAIAFPLERPGLNRFISTDPIEEGIPEDSFATAETLKKWCIDTVQACAPGVGAAEARDACNIILAYLDGESIALINDRFFPGEDLPQRMLDYSLRLLTLLTGFDGSVVEPQDYPKLDLSQQERN